MIIKTKTSVNNIVVPGTQVWVDGGPNRAVLDPDLAVKAIRETGWVHPDGDIDFTVEGAVEGTALIDASFAAVENAAERGEIEFLSSDNVQVTLNFDVDIAYLGVEVWTDTEEGN